MAFFAQDWTQGGVGAPQVFIYDLWLKVQPAMSFRAGPGKRGAHRGRPQRRNSTIGSCKQASTGPGTLSGTQGAATSQLTLTSVLRSSLFPSPQQDSSPAGAPPAAPPCAKPCVPGGLWPGPATGHQPLPTDVRGQCGEGLKGRTGMGAVWPFINKCLFSH